MKRSQEKTAVAESRLSGNSNYLIFWACLSNSTDGISFTDTTLTWTVPSVIPTLVLQESTFLSKNILMGIDDRIIVNPEEKNYLLKHNETHIGITVPIGAEGGKLKVSMNMSHTNTFEGLCQGICF